MYNNSKKYIGIIAKSYLQLHAISTYQLRKTQLSSDKTS